MLDQSSLCSSCFSVACPQIWEREKLQIHILSGRFEVGRLIEFSMRICFMGEQLFFILESNPHGFPYMALKYSALLHDFSFAGEGTFFRIIICFWLLRSY